MDMIEAEIAIVLTDIIASTKFVQKNGAQIAAKWFSAHDKMVLSLITRFNGQWVDNSDGHLMYFGTVQDAIGFACAYKTKLRVHKFPFFSRVGIHWDSMVIVKTDQKLIAGGVKRVNIEGIGKNIAARTMSICTAEQILLSNRAYIKFKARVSSSRHIPKNTLIACVGLYRFKGVSNPEQLWALGFNQASIQPPPSGEKATRLGGNKKIKTHFKHKALKEKAYYLFLILFKINLIYLLVLFWPFLASHDAKFLWGIDYWLFKPIEYLDYYFKIIIHLFKGVLK
jgi:class 3 adenylate cyclase